MKKLLIVLILVLCGYTAKAQGFGASFSAGYLSEIESIGGSLDLIYDFTEKWGVSTNATYSVADVRSLRTKWFAVDLNARYKVYDELYVLGGGEYLSITLKEGGLGGGSISQQSEISGNEFGINTGAGYKYNIIDNVNVFAEVKYVILDASYFHARLGMQFDF
jgi:opacity protein-like surface antigen